MISYFLPPSSTVQFLSSSVLFCLSVSISLSYSMCCHIYYTRRSLYQHLRYSYRIESLSVFIWKYYSLWLSPRVAIGVALSVHLRQECECQDRSRTLKLEA